MPLKVGLKKIEGLNTKTIIQNTNLPELDNPASISEIFEGREVIDSTGAKKTGTFTIDNEINTQESLVSQIITVLEGKAAAGSGATVETCQATFNNLMGLPITIYYTDKNLVFQTLDATSSVTFEPIMNGLILVTGDTATLISSTGTDIFINTSYDAVSFLPKSSNIEFTLTE